MRQGVSALAAARGKSLASVVKQRLFVRHRLPGLNELLSRNVKPKIGKSRRWSQGSQLKREWEGLVTVSIRSAGLKPMKWAKFVFTFYEPNRRRDPDNFCSSGMKLVFDALRRERILKNDGWDYVKGIELYWKHADPDMGAGVLVEMEGERL